jgi:hypothetical protein
MCNETKYHSELSDCIIFVASCERRSNRGKAIHLGPCVNVSWHSRLQKFTARLQTETKCTWDNYNEGTIIVTCTGRIWCHPNSSSVRESRVRLSADMVSLAFDSNFM